MFGQTLKGFVILQSRGQGPKKMENYGTNLSLTFNKNQVLAPWIGKQLYIEIMVGHFSNNPDIHGYFKKLLQHFSVW